MQKSGLLIYLLILLTKYCFSVNIPCEDDEGNLVTSCRKCLWRPDCVWCADRSQGPDNLSLGCIQRVGAVCSNIIDPSLKITPNGNQRPLDLNTLQDTKQMPIIMKI